jgi:hypothetical protein
VHDGFWVSGAEMDGKMSLICSQGTNAFRTWYARRFLQLEFEDMYPEMYKAFVLHLNGGAARSSM